jgi:hypothetical protein
MIDITNSEDRCFAMALKQCTILIETNCANCKFYKPRDCEDWVRINLSDGRIILVEPEEYEKLKGARHE